jgi:hypothetical protein
MTWPLFPRMLVVSAIGFRGSFDFLQLIVAVIIDEAFGIE